MRFVIHYSQANVAFETTEHPDGVFTSDSQVIHHARHRMATERMGDRDKRYLCAHIREVCDDGERLVRAVMMESLLYHESHPIA